ncbi:MAG: YolD-like family protein [Alphaproteobacteria bacterium]|nr:YolD-like family protein [Alphaproteobacteria bacterium]
MAASKEERARQFLTFNALTGYYQMILEKQRVSEPKKELSEDEAAALSDKLKSLRRHDLVSVTFYDKDAYITKTGMIMDIDFTFQTLTIVKTKIPFQDILRL